MIGFIDADILTGRSKFPNLAIMKLSGFHKSNGRDASLYCYDISEQLDKVHSVPFLNDLYSSLEKVSVSKVFSDPPLPDRYICNRLGNVSYGGTGSGYPVVRLDKYIEECQFPDYSIYDDYVEYRLKSGARPIDLQYYRDWSIGFITRGCFRKCPFCVNTHYDQVKKCSAPSSFVDKSRKYICLLDDNFLAYSQFEKELDELESFDKPFQFKQGLDFRLMTRHSMERFTKTKWRGDFIFAFDNINEKDVIIRNLSN